MMGRIVIKKIKIRGRAQKKMLISNLGAKNKFKTQYLKIKIQSALKV